MTPAEHKQFDAIWHEFGRRVETMPIGPSSEETAMLASVVLQYTVKIAVLAGGTAYAAALLYQAADELATEGT